jgi:hypothetical protein
MAEPQSNEAKAMTDPTATIRPESEATKPPLHPDGPATSALDDAARDLLYRHCCLAISEAGRERESLYLARLALLLFEAVGDAERCLAAIDEAGRDLPRPSLSAEG